MNHYTVISLNNYSDDFQLLKHTMGAPFFHRHFTLDRIYPIDTRFLGFFLSYRYPGYHAFQHACLSGNYLVVEFLIRLNILRVEQGFTKYRFRPNCGLRYACRSGFTGIAKLMISLGSTDWNQGLSNACLGKHQSLIELMVRSGAYHCYSCNQSMEEHLIPP